MPRLAVWLFRRGLWLGCSLHAMPFMLCLAACRCPSLRGLLPGRFSSCCGLASVVASHAVACWLHRCNGSRILSGCGGCACGLCRFSYRQALPPALLACLSDSVGFLSGVSAVPDLVRLWRLLLISRTCAGSQKHI